MRTILFVLLLIVGLHAFAQTKTLRYQGSVHVGLLEGEVGSSFQLQTVNGVQYKTWFGGIGAGLDYYHTRTIPLFVSFRKAFNSGTKSPFVYANSGYHFPWLRQQDKQGGETTAEGGLYVDAGIGYQLPVMKTSALFFTVGYSQKAFRTVNEYSYYYIDFWPQPEPQRTVLDYNLRRLSIQTGLRF